MRYSIAAVALAATTSVFAQNLSDLPACSLNCLVSAVPSTGCGLTDFPCVCKAADVLTPLVTPCAQRSCQGDDIAALPAALEKFCADAGVAITVPVPTPSATSSTAASSSSSAVVTSPTGSAIPSYSPTGSAIPSYTPTVTSGVASGTGTGTGTAPTSTQTFNSGASTNDLKIGAAAAMALAVMVL